MRSSVATFLLSGLLVLAGAAFSLVGASSDDAHEAPHEAHETQGGHGGHAGAHPWTGGTGKIPEDDAALDRRGGIVIGGDDAFNPANGVRSGKGTFDDPYVISGWHVDQVYIHDTTKAFEIKENVVTDILILDWTGQGGYVHHNEIHNLRTNRNVQRTGDPTAAVIENNRIGLVEELRHFDGIVANNTIGQEPILKLVDLDGPVALNIAGLNGAGIHDNLILGGVDMKIHGHHHSDKAGAHSHNHGQADEEQAEDHVEAAARKSEDQDARPEPRVENHQVRYVDFLFYNNTIRDDGFGLRYNDLNHAGDDRTATSEQEPDLERPHVHHTRVAIVNNVIDGAALEIAILNAKDERHVAGESAELVIMKNRVLNPSAGDGLFVHDVRNARVLVQENRVEKGAGFLGLGVGGAGGSGILLHAFENSSVELVDNWLGAYTYGIRASAFDENTTWSVGQNDAAGAEYAVYWDDSVKNEPAGAEGGAHEEHEHGHHADAAAPASVVRAISAVRLT